MKIERKNNLHKGQGNNLFVLDEEEQKQMKVKEGQTLFLF